MLPGFLGNSVANRKDCAKIFTTVIPDYFGNFGTSLELLNLISA